VAARRGSVRAIVRTRGVPAGIFASIAVLSAADIFTAYMPVLGEQRSIGPGVVGVLLGIRAAASMASRVGIGTIVARVGRVRLIAVSAAAAAIAFGAITVTDNVLALAVLCAVAGVGLGFGQPLSMTLVVQLVPEHARATALGVRLTGNRLGQVAAPAAAGVIAGSAGAGSVFWLTSAMLAASAVAIRRPAKTPSPAPVETAEATLE
jgi:MFS family permease